MAWAYQRINLSMKQVSWNQAESEMSLLLIIISSAVIMAAKICVKAKCGGQKENMVKLSSSMAAAQYLAKRKSI